MLPSKAHKVCTLKFTPPNLLKERSVLYGQKKLCMKTFTRHLHTVILNLRSAGFMARETASYSFLVFKVGNKSAGDSQESKRLGIEKVLSNQNGTVALVRCHISHEISNTPRNLNIWFLQGFSFMTLIIWGGLHMTAQRISFIKVSAYELLITPNHISTVFIQWKCANIMRRWRAFWEQHTGTNGVFISQCSDLTLVFNLLKAIIGAGSSCLIWLICFATASGHFNAHFIAIELTD